MIFSLSDKAGVHWTGQSFCVCLLKVNVLWKKNCVNWNPWNKFKVIFGVLQACTTWVLKGMKSLCTLMTENIPETLHAYIFQN